MHGLTARALDEIILGAHDDEPARPRVEPPGDFDDVRANNILGVRQRLAFEQAHEWFVAIGFGVTISPTTLTS